MNTPLIDGTTLKGDGSWDHMIVKVDGADLVVGDGAITCFGGSSDPQDDGSTASGLYTKGRPSLMACSIPMDFGSRVPNTAGCPIPRIPWFTVVEVKANGRTLYLPLIDVGPAKKTKNVLDLTEAAAKFFQSNATATNFKTHGSYRILNGARLAIV